MKINGVELAKAPHYRPDEPIVTISTYPSSHEQVVWPLTGATIDALCAELRRLARGMIFREYALGVSLSPTGEGLTLKVKEKGLEVTAETFLPRDKVEHLRDICNAVLGENSEDDEG